MKSIGVRDVDVDDAAGSAWIIGVGLDEVELHGTAIDEPIPSVLIQIGGEAQLSVAGEGGIKIVHSDDRGDAFEDNFCHEPDGSPRHATPDVRTLPDDGRSALTRSEVVMMPS